MTARAVVAASALAAACGGGADVRAVRGDASVQEEPPPCAADDESASPDDAVPLGAGEEASAYLCPEGDADFFTLEVPAGHDLVHVELGMDVDLTPVDIGYVVLGPDGSAIGSAADDDGARGGPPLVSRRHRVAPGDRLVVVVRDQADDERDGRNPYRLVVTPEADPDGNEPNDTAAQATDLAASAEGHISAAGDVDLFVADLAPPDRVSVRLSAGAPTIALRLTLTDPDGLVLIDMTDESGRKAAEEGIEVVRGVRAAGPHILAVRAADGVSDDVETPYHLELAALPEKDPNEILERNDDPHHATPLFPATVGAGETAETEVTGLVGSAGDVDVYEARIDAPAIAEIELSVAGCEAEDEDIVPVLVILGRDPRSPCAADDECALLAQPCAADEQCPSSECVDGACQGARLCLPGDLCGFAQFVRAGRRIRTAQPLLLPGPVWFTVADQGGQRWCGDPYRLRVRIFPDPDEHEPNNDYQPYLRASTDLSHNLPHAVPVPVGGAQVTGYLSYEADQDWFRFRMPCCDADPAGCAAPANACGFRVAFDVAAGATEPAWFLFLGGPGNLWGSWDADSAGAVYGDDECNFYNFRDVLVPATDYFLQVRDRDIDEWDPAQPYRFRVEHAYGCPDACYDEDDEIDERCDAPPPPDAGVPDLGPDLGPRAPDAGRGPARDAGPPDAPAAAPDGPADARPAGAGTRDGASD